MRSLNTQGHSRDLVVDPYYRQEPGQRTAGLERLKEREEHTAGV